MDASSFFLRLASNFTLPSGIWPSAPNLALQEFPQLGGNNWWEEIHGICVGVVI
jgi:hypothetical protein